MRNPLRYIFPFLLALIAIAFFGIADAPDSIAQESNTAAATVTLSEEDCIDTPSSCSDLNLPRQITGTSIPRLQSPSKRNGNSLELARICRITDAGTSTFIKKESLNIQYVFVKPACRLISLGKLII